LNGKIPVFVFLGPTAAGKTAFLFDLFACGRVAAPAEVISADSMQVYREMDIGTAKPDHAARTALPHHLIDLRDPSEQFDTGEFVRLADDCCAKIYAKGKLPIVAGGSGFYLKNFIQGLPDSPPGNQAIRQQLRREFATDDGKSLRNELQKGDPAAASRIHRNDAYRVIRALEVMRLTGKPLSAFDEANREKKEARAQRYAFLIAGLTRNREHLYSRINARVDRMFEQGLPDEVRALFAKGWTPDNPGMRAIGYREFFVAADNSEKDGAGWKNGEARPAPLPGDFRERPHPRWAFTSDIEGTREMIKQNSRHYAKRQETFFKGIEHVRHFIIERDLNEGDANEADNEDRIKASLRTLVQDFWGTYHA
jgi:tRNA dimethylallyltransferase